MTPVAEPIRILVAEDHPVYRDGLRALLSSSADVALVGEAEDGDAAVRLAAELQPDVVLMDIRMPGRNGIHAGARGYLLKDAEADELLRAIDAVAQGGAVFGPGVARRLVAFFASAGATLRPAPFPELTERERAVLDRMARGESNAVIADRLGISLKTVRNYASMIFDKLMVATRAEAIVRAREAGLGDVARHGGG